MINERAFRNWTFVIVSTVVGATQLTLGCGWLAEEYAFDARSEARTGTVVGFEATDTQLFQAKVRFEDAAGVSHTFTDSTAGGKDRYALGEQVPVRVPQDANEAVLDDGFMRKGFPAIFVVAGALVSLFAVLRLRIALRRAS